MRKWTNEEVRRYLGEEHGCYLSHSTDEEVRNGAASGGTTSQILINLLDRGLVDGVLVWRMNCGEAEPSAQPVIARTRQEVLDARGSKYTSVNVPQRAVPLIKAFDGKLAVVTVPCDASYLRRKMRTDPALAEKVACILTLFCGHNSEPELTKVVVQRHGAEWKDVESFAYRTGAWRGKLAFRTHQGREVEVPTRSFTHFQNLHFFSERKCLNCIDHFGFDGDICTGDIWSADAKGHDVKPTLLVAKSERGRELLDQATAAIQLEEVHPRVVINGNSRGMTYHYNISARAWAAKLFGIKIKDPLDLPVTLLDRMTATVGIFNYWWSHHPRYKHLIAKVPWWGIVGYIYFFKGLQQLNLFLYRPFPPVHKISLIGATLTGNRGAEAMLTTTIGKVREQYPDARFVIHSYFPKRDREICNDLGVDIVNATPLALVTQYFPFSVLDAFLRAIGLTWPAGWMPAGPRELRDSRALLDLFGVSYNDGREKFLPFNLLSNWPAMLMGVPVIKMSQGLGRFKHPLTRTIGKWMLRKSAKVFARGKESLEMCEELGLDANLEYAPDTAFCFEDKYSLTEENDDYAQELVDRLVRQREAGRKVLILSVSAVVFKKCTRSGIDYPEAMARVADHYLERGHVVVVFPNATREGLETHHNNDLPVIGSIVGRCRNKDSELLVPVIRDLNTASLRRVMSGADWLVASRFHAMIAGLSLGIPTMVVGWGHKYREVLAQFGIEENAYDYSELDAETLIARIDAFMEGAEDIRAQISEHVDEVKRASGRQFEWLAGFLTPQGNICTEDIGA